MKEQRISELSNLLIKNILTEILEYDIKWYGKSFYYYKYFISNYSLVSKQWCYQIVPSIHYQEFLVTEVKELKLYYNFLKRGIRFKEPIFRIYKFDLEKYKNQITFEMIIELLEITVTNDANCNNVKNFFKDKEFLAKNLFFILQGLKVGYLRQTLEQPLEVTDFFIEINHIRRYQNMLEIELSPNNSKVIDRVKDFPFDSLYLDIPNLAPMNDDIKLLFTSNLKSLVLRSYPLSESCYRELLLNSPNLIELNIDIKYTTGEHHVELFTEELCNHENLTSISFQQTTNTIPLEIIMNFIEKTKNVKHLHLNVPVGIEDSQVCTSNNTIETLQVDCLNHPSKFWKEQSSIKSLGRIVILDKDFDSKSFTQMHINLTDLSLLNQFSDDEAIDKINQVLLNLPLLNSLNLSICNNSEKITLDGINSLIFTLFQISITKLTFTMNKSNNLQHLRISNDIIQTLANQLTDKNHKTLYHLVIDCLYNPTLDFILSFSNLKGIRYLELNDNSTNNNCTTMGLDILMNHKINTLEKFKLQILNPLSVFSPTIIKSHKDKMLKYYSKHPNPLSPLDLNILISIDEICNIKNKI